MPCSKDEKDPFMRKILLAGVALASLMVPALAADLPSRKEAPVYVAPAPVFSWTGFYLGADIGASFASTSLDPVLSYNYYNWGNRSLNTSGFMGGGYLGYNYQVNQNFVLGVEGDFQGTTNGKSVTSYESAGMMSGTWTARANMGWLGAINGRLGIAADRALFYVIGGAAWAGANSSLSWSDGFYWVGGSTSKTLSGFDVGAGVEYAFTPNWVGRVEYRYYDFGNYNLNIPLTLGPYLDPGRLSTSVNTVRVGLAYLFSSPAPVVAKY
jgi:outer membrane immunogenic protein